MFVVKKFENGDLLIFRGTRIQNGIANIKVKVDEMIYSDGQANLDSQFETLSVHRFFCFETEIETIKDLFGA